MEINHKNERIIVKSTSLISLSFSPQLNLTTNKIQKRNQEFNQSTQKPAPLDHQQIP